MKTQREVEQYISRLGGRLKSLRHGKHWVGVADFDGKSIWFTVPNTPSDARSMRNNERWILGRVKGETG